ncbi:hypothetical protein BGZ63DRAFT_385754 [Mariannaea sp. PMI_226]|nr:hypothetical protein BGZ63DRAFT_385754 [Mariannaea sp. PMI_226]
MSTHVRCSRCSCSWAHFCFLLGMEGLNNKRNYRLPRIKERVTLRTLLHITYIGTSC